jgi:hypothetical protein
MQAIFGTRSENLKTEMESADAIVDFLIDQVVLERVVELEPSLSGGDVLASGDRALALLQQPLGFLAVGGSLLFPPQSLPWTPS